jgi:predicted TIM-barrel fold metal-dependent hydrolase
LLDCPRVIARRGRGKRKGRLLHSALADYIGPNKIMWATDYPHRDGFFPGTPDMVRERDRFEREGMQ